MSKQKFTAHSMPSMKDKTVLVTGGSGGLGAVTGRELARAGAHVVLAVRDTARGEAAARTMPGSTEVRRLDVSDLDSVRAFAEEWNAPLDILVNNAGVMAIPRRESAQGFEMQFATNHLGPFALTNLLLPHITDRVVTVSSNAHRRPGAAFDFADPNSTVAYQPWRAYQASKLANLLFTRALERRLRAVESTVSAHAAHPGYSATGLQGKTGHAVQGLLLRVTNRLLAQPAEMGALPILYAATQPLPGASYTGPAGRGELRGHPAPARMAPAALDDEAAERLWLLSDELTGAHFPFTGSGAT
ncbi:oxidoreductase [Streptomyces sp. NPDC090021]|uniref:oxidoreductase n=1 Tax=Streptomyces sp. NPDC090021 TaxID=3365919 RepID=UPI003814FF10